ncbi:hypothetical protein PQU94_02140 [Asticcacaulis sp. DXS10W]|uniref:Uncharacterized protein n=1 Tax=Asticcacaulis currens TaxID=2984210 RepID=A0ABT5IA65_9CAUL|nr:hypothetical protein [Asticcacaulis currens]MDC7693075.1 hypothetical protein [Asticcacaulis currens]
MRNIAYSTVATMVLMSAGVVHANEVVTLTKPPVFKAPTDIAATEIPSTYKPKQKAKTSDFEPLRGPWRVTKSLKDKGKEPVDENGNTYACVDKDCKVSRKVDERRD